MFLKRTITLIALIALLAILYSLWISKKQRSEPLPTENHLVNTIQNSQVSTDLPLFPTDQSESLIRVKIEDLSNSRQFEFEKRDSGWQMIMPIQFSVDVSVARFINSLPAIRAQKKFSAQSSELAQYGLDRPQIKLCAFFKSIKSPICYEFGNSIPNGSGCYGRNGYEVVIVPKPVRDLWLGQSEYALARKQVFPVLYYDAVKITIRDNAWFSEVSKSALGWELLRGVPRLLNADEVKHFFTLISNLHVRSFLSGPDRYQTTINPNQRIVIDFEGSGSESLVLGAFLAEHSGYYAKLSSVKTPFILSKEKYDELVQYVKSLSLGSVV